MGTYNSAFTGEQVDNAVELRHSHSNKTVINKFSEVSGNVNYNGSKLAKDSELGAAASKNVGTGANDVAAGNHIHSIATSSLNGFLSKEDKAFIDSIDAIYSKKTSTNRSIGLLTVPTITYSGNNAIIGEGLAYLCACTEFNANSNGTPITVPAKTFNIANEGTTNYILAVRTGETAEYVLSANRNEIAKPNIALVAVIIRTGAIFHTFQTDALAAGLPNRLECLLIARDGFRKVSGLGLSASERIVTVASGMASFGANIKELDAVISNVDNILFYFWDGTSFIFSQQTLANHTQFNGASGLTSMQANRFNVNWFWRGVESQKHLYSVLSREQYTSLANALASPVPEIPSIIANHAVLVGGVVYRNGNTTPQGFIAIDQRVGTTPITEHNNLGGLQGGQLGEYFHLTVEQRNWIATKMAEES